MGGGGGGRERNSFIHTRLSVKSISDEIILLPVIMIVSTDLNSDEVHSKPLRRVLEIKVKVVHYKRYPISTQSERSVKTH